MLSDKDKNKISNYCYIAVSGLFADFINESNRGINFTWGKFPKLAANMCFTHIFTSNPPRAKLEEYKTHAFDTAYQIAENLVSRAGLNE